MSSLKMSALNGVVLYLILSTCFVPSFQLYLGGGCGCNVGCGNGFGLGLIQSLKSNLLCKFSSLKSVLSCVNPCNKCSCGNKCNCGCGTKTGGSDFKSGSLNETELIEGKQDDDDDVKTESITEAEHVEEKQDNVDDLKIESKNESEPAEEKQDDDADDLEVESKNEAEPVEEKQDDDMLEDDSNFSYRVRRSAEPKMVMDALEICNKLGLKTCVARSICYLSCNPNGFGKEGEKAIENMLKIQTSLSRDLKKNSELKIYKKSAVEGMKARSAIEKNPLPHNENPDEKQKMDSNNKICANICDPMYDCSFDVKPIIYLAGNIKLE